MHLFPDGARVAPTSGSDILKDRIGGSARDSSLQAGADARQRDPQTGVERT
jgi:hypothetical protein